MSVEGVFVGKAEPMGGGLCSAIDKKPVDQRLWLWPQGLGHDEQGDLRFHGGPERALHHYPREHYRYWRQRYPALQWPVPAFGENLSTLGVTEEDVCIGDLFRWGGALIQISQPRSPCYRLSRRWTLPTLPQDVQDSGRCGWFYRVVEPGFVSVEDRLEQVRRDYPGLTVALAIHHYFHAPLDRAGLRQLVACDALSSRWRDTAARRLATHQVEDWTARLGGLPLEGKRA